MNGSAERSRSQGRAAPGADRPRSREWAGLQSGVDRKAPLSRFYSRKSIESLGEGVQSFQRWGFEQGQAPLVGALTESQPIPAALAAAIAGTMSPEQAARQAQQAVRELATATG